MAHLLRDLQGQLETHLVVALAGAYPWQRRLRLP